ncbi:Coenzyme F420 hydrogenase/dehydrogenase, beta subunit C-terminal domain [uncultured Bacteroides sp.]|uniref:Coenzyme F420 hydrogenase/dehydrogenase, beta subunit C-terminal domain n=1 Tax=uncultured Bacteroides sp. TaxID=162156 RepID=UPI002AAC2C4A|nr:Coenzyme F420 hydrogenase/dehydrogenase, beta subunit C-terminal domain [uncultured Bacteroides sp.]
MEFKINSLAKFIGYSMDERIRYKSSSGGIGTGILKYLFEIGYIETAVSLVYDAELCKYRPEFIYCFEDFNNCGSVYHEIELIEYIKENYSKVKGRLSVFCMGCQVNYIRKILQRHNIESFILSLVCSGQTEIKGIYTYYRLLGIKKEDIFSIQFRGNGWPSGIQIKLKNGNFLKRNNWTEPWSTLHTSHLYQPRKCFFCKESFNKAADVSLADPWLDKYINIDTVGNTIFCVNTNIGIEIITAMINKRLIYVTEAFDSDFLKSQHSIYMQRLINPKSHRSMAKIANLCGNIYYRNIMSSCMFTLKIHNNIVLKLMNKRK